MPFPCVSGAEGGEAGANVSEHGSDSEPCSHATRARVGKYDDGGATAAERAMPNVCEGKASGHAQINKIKI